MKQRLPSLDLFSGIGGMSYALRDTLKPVAYCEIHPLCISILKSCFERNLLDAAPVHPDVRLLNGKELKQQPVIVTAGFPCQDISAGNPKGNGIDGARSGLIRHVFRLVDECSSVQAVFLENSPFIVTRGLKFVLDEFADRGFVTSWVTLGAQDVGGLHLRRTLVVHGTQGRFCSSKECPRTSHRLDTRAVSSFGEKNIRRLQKQQCLQLRFRQCHSATVRATGFQCTERGVFTDDSGQESVGFTAIRRLQDLP